MCVVRRDGRRHARRASRSSPARPVDRGRRDPEALRASACRRADDAAASRASTALLALCVRRRAHVPRAPARRAVHRGPARPTCPALLRRPGRARRDRGDAAHERDRQRPDPRVRHAGGVLARDAALPRPRAGRSRSSSCRSCCRPRSPASRCSPRSAPAGCSATARRRRHRAAVHRVGGRAGGRRSSPRRSTCARRSPSFEARRPGAASTPRARSARRRRGRSCASSCRSPPAGWPPAGCSRSPAASASSARRSCSPATCAARRRR